MDDVEPEETENKSQESMDISTNFSLMNPLEPTRDDHEDVDTIDTIEVENFSNIDINTANNDETVTILKKNEVLDNSAMSELLDQVAEKLKITVAENLDTDLIAEKIWQKMKSIENETDETEKSDIFTDKQDGKLYCGPCIKFSRSSLLPSKLSKCFKGNFGIFEKPDSDQSKTNKERRRRLNEHTRTELHNCCVEQQRQEDVNLRLQVEKNTIACEMMITSAIQCLLEVDGSLKFVRVNNMLQTLLPESYPTKNDGRQNFFKFRESVFLKITTSIQESFKSVKNACFSLDKVTVRRTPFTVIMTYFFYDGKIHVLLNSVHKMNPEEYSGAGAAEMLGKVLMTSLGLSKEDVAEKFCHGTYDGVYATTQERVRGGGSLNLIHHFAEWCNKPKTALTGHWDVGHQLQLVFADALKSNKPVKQFLGITDNLALLCQGKDGLTFTQVASEMKSAFLTDKSEQTTRWVRSLLRLLLAFYRNMPTVQRILSQEVEEARVSGDITEQKTIQKRLDLVTDSSQLAFGVGLAQILDMYAEVSLNAQRLWSFPGNTFILLDFYF